MLSSSRTETAFVDNFFDVLSFHHPVLFCAFLLIGEHQVLAFFYASFQHNGVFFERRPLWPVNRSC